VSEARTPGNTIGRVLAPLKPAPHARIESPRSISTPQNIESPRSSIWTSQKSSLVDLDVAEIPVRWLLDRGANVKCKPDKDGRTPRSLALKTPDDPTSRLVLETLAARDR